MKKIFIYIFTLFLISNSSAITLQEALEYAQSNPLVKAAKSKAQSYKKLQEASKSAAYYPSLDLSYKGIYLQDKPTVNFNLPVTLPGLSGALQIEPKNQYSGALTLSYPLFTGFALQSQIQISKLEAEKAKLQILDTKRNLYLEIVQVYSAGVALKQLIQSQTTALQSTQKSYKKAQTFYKLGMIAPAQLYKFSASLHTIEAQLIETKNQYKITLKQLSFLSHHHITGTAKLPKIVPLKFGMLQKMALQKRPDIKILSHIVKEQQTKITLTKSQYYPNIALFARAAYTGDTPRLNGDDYTNKNKSALGFVINYNIFNGFQTKNELQAAQEAKLSSEFMLTSYKEKVTSKIYQDYLSFSSYKKQLQAAKATVKAAKSYQVLLQAQFENQIADADTLSRAISASAMARAQLIQTKARMYLFYAKVLLEVSNNTFLNSFNKDKKND